MRIKMTLVWVGVIAMAGLTGCESPQSRLKERENLAGGWSPMMRERLVRGEIKEGDTFDMVYVAIGSPDDSETFTVQDGTTATIWTYPDIKHRLQGEETVGYEVITEYDVRTGQRIQYQIPVREKFFKKIKRDGMQVIFREGRVTSVRWLSKAPPAAAGAAASGTE